MGIDVSDSLIIGASFEELEDFIVEEAASVEDPDDLCGVIEKHFDYASPYYDSDIDDWFIGFRVKNCEEVNQEWFDKLLKLSNKFEELTGIKPRLRGGAHVW